MDDLEKAKANRERVARHENIKGYLNVEEALRKTPIGKSLPKWIPEGYIPQLSHEESMRILNSHSSFDEDILEDELLEDKL